jgi:hypothetical protein
LIKYLGGGNDISPETYAACDLLGLFLCGAVNFLYTNSDNPKEFVENNKKTIANITRILDGKQKN